MLLQGFIGSSFQNFEGCSSSEAKDFVHEYRTCGFWKGGLRLELDGVLSPFFVTAGLEFQIDEANSIMPTINTGFQFFK